MTFDWKKEFEKQFGYLPGAPAAPPAAAPEASPRQAAADLDVDPTTGETDEGGPPPPRCPDCYDKPGIVIDSFVLRGLRIQKVKCPTCGKTRNRQTGGTV